MLDSRRHASHSYKPRSSSKSRLMSGSNLSQESQLAHDFRTHANVTSSSSTSLGRHGQSSMSLHDVPPVPQQYLHDSTEMFQQGQGSAPTSPYGHPKGTAVANGQGIGRDYIHQGLPPISDWEGQGQGMINPMFRVVGTRVITGSNADSSRPHKDKQPPYPLSPLWPV